MNSFSFYRNYFDTLSAVPEEQRLECYEAIMRYMFLGEEPQGMAKIIIQALSVSLEKSKKRASAGATSNEIKQEQTETNEIKRNQTKSNRNKRH